MHHQALGCELEIRSIEISEGQFTPNDFSDFSVVMGGNDWWH